MHRDSAYFEQETIWASELTDAERACIELVGRLWPADARTMLDAGAGAGRLLNNIRVNATAVACDFSATALKRVRAPSVAALATVLPFRDRSFDLSLCSNVLEHLTEPDLALAFGELARVSSKYVMIVSPIGEPIETQLTICRRCGCQFHPNGHRRRLNVPDFEAGLPEFATETVSFFAEPFLMVSPLAAAAERALGRDIHHYAGAMCPNCNWVEPLASSPEPPGPALWDLGLQSCLGNRSNRCIPSSAIVLLRRGTPATGQLTPLAPKLRIAAREDALPAVSLAARPLTGVDLCERVGALSPAALAGCVLLTPDSAWKPLPDRPDLRIEGGHENGYAVFCLPAEEVAACRELRLDVSGSLEPGIQVEFHDTVLGYVGLGSIQPVEPARTGEVRRVVFKLPALPRPGGPNALFRLFRRAGSIGWVEFHAIGLDLPSFLRARPLTKAERAAGTVDLGEALAWFSGPFAVRSEGPPVTVQVDATALGCRDGSIDLDSGQSVIVPSWLGADRPDSPAIDDAVIARTAARLGHDVGLLFRRLRSFEELEAVTGATLIDMIAGASGESPARVRDLLNPGETVQRADFAALEGRVAFPTAHSEAIEARQTSAERLVEERDRTIADLDGKLTNLSDLLNRVEANRTAAERAALEARQGIAELEGQLAASWTHAEAIEARRTSAERLVEERDRTIADLDGKLTNLSDLLNRVEANRTAAERAALEARQGIAELEGQLAASWTHAEAIEARRTSAERLVEERDRTIADLDGKLTNLSDLLNRVEANRTAAERAALEARQGIAELEGQLAASWTHAEAIEARRADTERLLQERDRTIAGLEGKLMKGNRWFEKTRRKSI